MRVVTPARCLDLDPAREEEEEEETRQAQTHCRSQNSVTIPAKENVEGRRKERGQETYVLASRQDSKRAGLIGISYFLSALRILYLGTTVRELGRFTFLSFFFRCVLSSL